MNPATRAVRSAARGLGEKSMILNLVADPGLPARRPGYGDAMPARRAPHSALAAVLLALGLAGCSLDDDEQKAADSLEPALVTNGADEAERDSAGCVAETWVGEVGTASLVKAALLTRGLEARRPA